MGVSIGEMFNTLQVYLGSLYVNDFNRFGRTWQVNVQADAKFRSQIDDIKQIKIRNAQGNMVPLGDAGRRPRRRAGPVLIMRYNMYPAAAINGTRRRASVRDRRSKMPKRRPGTSCRARCGPNGPSWRCLQLQTGNTAMLVFLLAVVLVFLVLAAQYESWSLPLAVILVVPMCLLCSVVGVLAAHLDINIFTQVGFVVLIGLACKNAILIVEFAKSESESGLPPMSPRSRPASCVCGRS